MHRLTSFLGHTVLLSAVIASAAPRRASAQLDTTRHTMPGMPVGKADGTRPAPARGDTAAKPSAMGGMSMRVADPLGVSMERMGSGTTWVPDAAPIPSRYFAAPGQWDVMLHGFAFAEYDKQSGRRGGQQLGSLSWLMAMASHELAGGRFQARTMLSLDVLGVTPRGYPLLLQPGEAYNGQVLYDRQHPHDVLMELSALYERPLTRSVGVMLYVAPSGEPALGPAAFMHRPSATDNPAAPLGHSRQDETHVAFGVVTVGVFTHMLKLEGSVFNGRDPDQNRIGIDPIRLDSYSGRLTFNPTAAWSFTTGYGYAKSPDAGDPSVSLRRLTASAIYASTLGHDGQWSASAVYGADKHAGDPAFSRAMTLESEVLLDQRHTVFTRAEYVQNTAAELGLDEPQFGLPAEYSFHVTALSLGYIRDVVQYGPGTLGLGAMGTVNLVPSPVGPAYGSRSPRGAMIFLRLRPSRSAMTANRKS